MEVAWECPWAPGDCFHIPPWYDTIWRVVAIDRANQIMHYKVIRTTKPSWMGWSGKTHEPESFWVRCPDPDALADDPNGR